MCRLKEMNDEDFEWFIELAVQNFAKDKVENGSWEKETAEEQSRQAFAGLLPQGIETPNQFLRCIMGSNENKVGYLWFAIKEEETEKPHLFLYEIFLLPEARGQGIGEAAIMLLKQEAQERGVDKIWLHVFGHNERAYNFYKKLGFIVTDYTMSVQTDI